MLGFALLGATLSSLLAGAPAHAIGMGELQLQSSLGQPLRATIGILGSDPSPRPAGCYSARLSTADGAFIVSPRVTLAGGVRGGMLVLATGAALTEPALSLQVEIACGDAVRKEFMLLLDPPLAFAAPQGIDQAARRTPTGRRAAAPATDATAVDGLPAQAATFGAATTTIAAAPTRVPRPRQIAAAVAIAPPATDKSPAAAAPAAKPARSVLRMSARASTSAADTDLINAIGLRLALADRLGSGSRSTAGTSDAADAANLAADRAARARFLDALRGDAGTGAAEPVIKQGTEQRLQQLQANTRLLEKETATLKQKILQDDAPRASAGNLGKDNPLLAGLVALLVVSLVAIAWLLWRMQHLQWRNRDWVWDENVAAADARAARAEPTPEIDEALSLEAEAHAESAARAAQQARAQAEAREIMQAKAEADSRHSLDDSFWEPAVAAPLPDAATPLVKPAMNWGARPAALSADLAELAMVANTVGARSPIAVPAVPVVAAPTSAMPRITAILPTARPVVQAPPPEAAPAPLSSTMQMDTPPMVLLPDLAFPDKPSIAPLEFTSSANVPVSDNAPGAPIVPLAAALSLPHGKTNAKPASTGDLQFAEIRVQSTSVEEISDVMQEAEFWLSLHDLERAAEVLEPYATYEQPGSPLPWLYLFELYRDLGWQEKYDTLRDRFQRIFNGRALTWDEQENVLPNAVQRGVEDVPHVALKLTTLWQSDQILPYMESLLIDDRDGMRAGFDLAVYKEIMFLILLAYELEQWKQYQKPAVGSAGATILA